MTVVAAELEPSTASALARLGSGLRRNPTIIAGVLTFAGTAVFACRWLKMPILADGLIWRISM